MAGVVLEDNVIATDLDEVVWVITHQVCNTKGIRWRDIELFSAGSDEFDDGDLGLFSLSEDGTLHS